MNQRNLASLPNVPIIDQEVVMRIKKYGSYYIMRLEKGEEIITAVKAAVSRSRIRGAFFFGLGVGKDLVLGYYDPHHKKYIKRAFKGEYEFTSLAGNIAHADTDCIVHCHVTITNEDFAAFGGHLFQGTIPATGEIIIFPLPRSLRRSHDTLTGLKLLDI
jgi:predicted DNA-binding protein with PD1-like motif